MKAEFSNLVRKLGVINAVDNMLYTYKRVQNSKVNKAFKKEYPDVPLPPDYLMYESFGINYKTYFLDSQEAAKELASLFAKHIQLKNANILDWGCGPGRLIRHMPKAIGNGCKYYGTDYNKDSIAWCSENLPEIKFNHNGIEAQLPYEDNQMDVIYGISIFTHLSPDSHYDWYKELYRVLKPGGIMLLTMQGDNFKAKLTEEERKEFDKNHLVVRGYNKDGHRLYSAFHPKAFVERLFTGVEILEHIVKEPKPGGAIPQDIWLVKKA
ncbi:MAG: class I SAM-dependent methyltransferase [Schleiferiaceae bacterium]|nr:class I SAM-dependent methyltransferase [Schleiferiaceae bacterium]